eukprot:g3681.t1
MASSHPSTSFGPPLNLRTKVVVLGQPKVGKTAFREVVSDSGAFPRSYTVTLGRESSVKLVQFTEKNITVELHLQEWGGFNFSSGGGAPPPGNSTSQAGQNSLAGLSAGLKANDQKEKAVNEIISGGARAFIFMYDTSDPASFDGIAATWLSGGGACANILDKVEGEPPLAVCVVGNKTDLPVVGGGGPPGGPFASGRIGAEEAAAALQSNRPDLRMQFFECSAMENTGLNDVCESIATAVVANYENRVRELAGM